MEKSTLIEIAKLTIMNKLLIVDSLPEIPKTDKVLLRSSNVVYWNIGGKWEPGETIDEMAAELLLIAIAKDAAENGEPGSDGNSKLLDL